ncbi:MAG: GNAT family N-acetyltransferase [Longicatena sp.]
MDGLNLSIIKLTDLDDQAKAEAIQVYTDCFPVYNRISKHKKTLSDFFMDAFDFNLTYAAVIDKKIIGFLAISNGKERSLKFDKSKCINVLGKVMGVITYHEMKFILGRPNLENETDIGIDYLATREAYRGKGIASKLIEYACVNLCDKECFIDVDANNTVAKRLYEYLGFKEYDQHNSMINRMLGFGCISRMKKRVN